MNMNRRIFLQSTAAAAVGTPLLAALEQSRLEGAGNVLAQAVARGQVAAATIFVQQGDTSFGRAYGKAATVDAMFLLGSISKPINMTALMTLFDRGEFKLDDPLQKFLPQFTGNGREAVTMQHLLTHTSGLPDQLADNDILRRRHAPLAEFVAGAVQTPLAFAPGTKYQYSSMAILLAAHVAERISGTDIHTLVDRTVFEPLGMRHSAQGLGRFKLEDLVQAQTEFGAVESGGGNPSAKEWDWNSPYWRKLGASWGGTHCSAPDVARWLGDLLHAEGKTVRPDTARLMTRNHNSPGLMPRGLGLNVGSSWSAPNCSERTFGHTGSTGTIAWADPATETICVVLTSLPARAVTPHPRDLAAAEVAAAAK